MCKLFHALLFRLTHLLLVYVAGFLQDMPDLMDGDDREEFGEEEITGEEQPESPDIEAHFPDRRPVIRRPAAGNVVPVNRRHDDHETLEPHPDIHDDGHEEGDGEVPAHLPEPEDLRRQHVTAHHDIIAPSQGSEDIDAVLHEGPVLEFIHAVPGDEQLGQIGHADDRAGQYNDLIHDLDMLEGDILFKMQYLPRDQQQRLYHRKTGEDGARYEIRREDGRMPSRDHRSGEVKGYDGVYGQYQGSAQTGQHQRQRLMPLPVLGRTRPSERSKEGRSSYASPE